MPDDGRFLSASPSAAPTAKDKPQPRRLRWPPAGRAFRLALGAALLAAGAAFLYDRFVVLEARQAVLDGAVVTLRSPIEGQLDSLAMVAPGTLVAAGTTLAMVRNDRLDEARLNDLGRLRRIAAAEAAAHARRLGVVRAELAAAEANAAAYATTRTRMLLAQLREAESGLAAAAARHAEAVAALRRAESLVGSGVLSLAALDAARRAAGVAEAELRAAEDRRELARTEHGATAAGVLASDASHDRSASQLSAERLRLLAAELEAMVAEAETRAAALGEQVASEGARQGRMRQAALVVREPARIVRRLAYPGEHLAAGQGVVQLAECERPEVVALVTPRVFRRLQQGAPALFHPADGGTPREGRIAALRAQPPEADGAGGRLEVVVELRREDAGSCDSGRLGRLTFP